MPASLDRLDERQRALLDGWLPGARLVADHSWGLIDTVVLRLAHAGEHYVVKASRPTSNHIGRELRAHREWLSCWTSTGRAPRLAFGDDEANILVTHWLPGQLVENSPAQQDPEVFRQAGELLSLLHAEPRGSAPTTMRPQCLRWLDSPHRIDPEIAELARCEVAAWTEREVAVVATHGDWQPRNWLVDVDASGAVVVRIIDFGSAALRPAVNDCARLARQDFARDSRLEAAFLAGYGSDPRQTGDDLWRMVQLREALSTAAWAFHVGDQDFEAQGHRWLAALYAGRDRQLPRVTTRP